MLQPRSQCSLHNRLISLHNLGMKSRQLLWIYFSKKRFALSFTVICWNMVLFLVDDIFLITNINLIAVMQFETFLNQSPRQFFWQVDIIMTRNLTLFCYRCTWKVQDLTSFCDWILIRLYEQIRHGKALLFLIQKKV